MPDTPIDVSLNDLLQQRQWLVRLATALVRDPHHAEDAAQQTWLQAFTARSSVRDARGWLAAVLGNTVRQRHRADVRRKRRERDVTMQHTRRDDASAAANERFETQRIVAAAVQGLAEPFRSTVLLHHFEGVSLAAIARSQGVPAGTVRWRLHRAHALLRTALASQLGSDWRHGVLALCVPLRRGALAAPVVALVVAVGLVATAIVQVASGIPKEEPVARFEPVAAAHDDVHERLPVDRALAREPTDRPAAGATPADPVSAADQRAMVRARIVGSDGAPLPDATLRVARAELGRREAPEALLGVLVPAATAGSDGRVVMTVRVPRDLLALLDDLPSDGLVVKVALVASAPGHADAPVELHLANGDDRDLGTFELGAVTTIVGRVLGADGEPLGDARVCALHPPFPRFCEVLAAAQHVPSSTLATTTAYRTGAFELGGVRAGQTIVWASKPGFTSAWRLLDATPRHTHCDDLVLAPAPEQAPAPTQTDVRVIVVDERGERVDAQVCYRQRLANGATANGSFRVGARGTTKLPTLCLGRGDEPIFDLELAAISESPTLANVVVPHPAVIDGEIRIVLPPATPLEVRANGENGLVIADFTVAWNADAPALGKACAQGARGVATLAAPPTPATFEIHAAGWDVQRVPFVPGETASPLIVTLAPQRGITGVVTAAGKPVANACVSVLRCDRPVLLDGYRSVDARDDKWDARTGRDGGFRIERAEAGELRLQVRAGGLASAVTAPHDYDPPHGWNDVAIELSAGGTIEGIVRDRAGAVVPRALVAVHDFHGDARTMLADAAGRFHFAHLRPAGYEVRIGDRELDGNWSSTVVLTGVSAGTAPHADCVVRAGEVTNHDLVTDRCRLNGSLLPTGFHPRGWRATLMRAHDGLPTCEDAVLDGGGAFALSSSSTGPHDLRLSAPGGPLGNVTLFLRIGLADGDNSEVVPLALAPLRARAAGASGARDGSWAHLEQRDAAQRVLTYVHVDPSTLEFWAPLAPIGENVLFEEDASAGAREIGRFFVVPR